MEVLRSIKWYELTYFIQKNILARTNVEKSTFFKIQFFHFFFENCFFKIGANLSRDKKKTKF